MEVRVRTNVAKGGFCWSLCLTALIVTGCQTGTYRASSLPPEFAAPPVVSLDSFQLTHLGPSVARNDTIHPGDKVKVTLLAGDEDDMATDWEIMVAEDGAIAVPLVGPLRVAGMTPAAAAALLREASIRQGIYVNPAVSVTFMERKVNQITVAGAVNKPGSHDLPAGASTLAAALVAAGGLSDAASPIVEVQNPSRRESSTRLTGVHGATHGVHHASFDNSNYLPAPGLVRLNLLDVSASPDSTAPTANRPLDDGAVVTVLEMPERHITMMGLTGNKTMPLPPNRQTRLLDALANAGGTKYSIWIADKVKVIRQVPGSDETVTINASIRRAKRDSDENILLAAGDIVSVEENAITFTIDTVSALLGVGVAAARMGTGAY